MSETYREWLSKRTCNREDLEQFLKSEGNNWARFDEELGYVLNDSTMPDGLDGSYTTYRYESSGARKIINYADRPCRINTYGNSYTQCHQVSDGETWQEVLAAHLGEPIRNFGVGGYGVYQAYRRLLRHETSSDGVENVLFYIYNDDHRRSLFPCRWLFTHQWSKRKYPGMFHSNPWDHLELNLDTGRFEEKPSACPTPDSLRELTQGDAIYEKFHRNTIVQLDALREGVMGLDFELLGRLADWAEYPLEKVRAEDPERAGHELALITGIRASCYILEKLQQFVQENGKRLLVLLGYNKSYLTNTLNGIERPDEELRKYLEEHDMKYFDIMPHHIEDFSQFRLDPQEYLKRYSVGHYSPVGNAFFAFSLKDTLVDWLEPKPLAYRQRGEAITFDTYLKD